MTASKLSTVSSPDLELVNGIPLVNSLKIAENFGRKHLHVLEAIRKLLPDVPDDFRESNFRSTHVETSMPTGGLRKDPAFNLTRDAFTLLAMGFTGKQALAWKLRYIEAFNAMEGKLLAQQKMALTEARKEGIAIGARAAVSISPERRARIVKVLRYRSLGLTQVEVGKLLDMSKAMVNHMVRDARRLGLEAS